MHTQPQSIQCTIGFTALRSARSRRRALDAGKGPCELRRNVGVTYADCPWACAFKRYCMFGFYDGRQGRDDFEMWTCLWQYRHRKSMPTLNSRHLFYLTSMLCYSTCRADYCDASCRTKIFQHAKDMSSIRTFASYRASVSKKKISCFHTS